MPTTNHPDGFSMSFGDHLEELRRRLFWAIAVPLPLAIVIFIFSDPIIEWLYRPLDPVLESFQLPRRLQALGPAEVLIIKLKLSLISAAVVAAPWILWQTWLFVRPGLHGHERRFVHFLLPGSAVLTATGLSLMYFIMLPLMLRMLVLFGTSLQLGGATVADDPRVAAVIADSPAIELRMSTPASPAPGEVWLEWPQMDLYMAVAESADADGGSGVEIVLVPTPSGSIISQEFRLTTYIDFVLLLMLGIVVAFQMPLVILLLGWVGIVSEKELRAKRKYALFACAVTAAVITPADAVSMVIMLVPLVALYELSILLLVLVPASAVAEGTVVKRFWRGGRSGRS
jgi:Sec-independent protein secretion pathway component TatC